MRFRWPWTSAVSRAEKHAHDAERSARLAVATLDLVNQQSANINVIHAATLDAIDEQRREGR